MSRLCKLIEAMLRLPPEVDFDDVKKLLERFDWTHDRQSGSHHIFVPPGGGFPLNVPTKGGRTVKKTYLVQLVQRLELENYYEEHCR